MLLLSIEIRLLMNNIVTTMGILVRMRPVVTPVMLAEWASEFRTIWQLATQWVEGFHLGTIQPTIWQSATLAKTEDNARATFRQPIFPAELFASLRRWSYLYHNVSPTWDAARAMGENPDSFVWYIQTHGWLVTANARCRLCPWWQINPQVYDLLRHCHRCPARQSD